MHRLPSESVLRRFRIASVLVLLMWLSAPVAVGLLVCGLFFADHELLVWSGGCVVFGVVAMIVSFVVTSRLRCPLCMVQPLQNKGCSKHRNARTLFGSHRLKVAQSILVHDSFRCPYCGEPTVMEARKRRR